MQTKNSNRCLASLLLGLLLSGGMAWGQEARVIDSGLVYQTAPFPSCHASTVCQTAEGDLLVAFFGGSWEGCEDVCIWSCRKGAGEERWSAPQCVADGRRGDTAQHPCWNPVLYRLPGHGNEVLLFYKTGRYIPQWVGHIKRSADGGRTWGAAEPLPSGLLGAIKNPPIRHGRRLIAPSSTEPAWQPHFEIGNLRGRHWRKASVPPDTSIIAIQPALLTLPGDSLLALMRTKNGYLAQTLSADGGRHWSPLTLTDIPNNNSGIDAITLHDGRHAMVYTPLGLTPGSEFGPRTPLVLALSADGLHWHTLLTLEDAPGEYSYPTLIEGDDHTLHIVYTYRRTHIKYVHVALHQSTKSETDQ